MKSHKSRLLRMFILNLVMLLVGLATFVVIEFNQAQAVAIENQALWLESYAKSFLNDLKTGNSVSMQNKLQILADGKYFSAARLLLDSGDLEAVRRSASAATAMSRLASVLPFDQTTSLEVPVKDRFNSTWGILAVTLDPVVLLNPLAEKLSFFLYFVLGYSSVLMGILLLGLSRETEELSALIQYIKSLVRNQVDNRDAVVKAPSFSVTEWSLLAQEFSLAIRQVVSLQKQMKEQELEIEIGRISGQVAHDIRSPLSALNMVMTTLQSLPEEKRLIIRYATQRINDIANQLLQKSKTVGAAVPPGDESVLLGDSKPELVMLMAHLDAIVSEKRVQFRDSLHLEIQGDLTCGYGLFARVPTSEFSSVISNLINNSVESLSGPGRIVVSIHEADSRIVVTVKDNGPGIPPERLKLLGGRGVSYGKEGTSSGSGLGLYHARETLEKLGGKLVIHSNVGTGTVVSLVLPKSETPAWFVEKISIAPGATIVSVDDDRTIHQIWSERLSNIRSAAMGISHLTFSTLEQFEYWHQTQDKTNLVYLVDFEFLNQSGNGLDTIARTNIAARSILVTSRDEDTEIRNRAEALGVKILPKSLAPFVPIVVA